MLIAAKIKYAIINPMLMRTGSIHPGRFVVALLFEYKKALSEYLVPH
jgi:hypothetical protein